ncbi:MAG: efflux RND transporter periplasmic adaptor subunit [Cyclobacteriaceae bacterium]
MYKSIIGFASILLGLAFQACENEKAAKEAPIVEVPVIQVQSQDVPIYQEFVGQTFGQSDIKIRSRVDGWITGIHFKEGSPVKKGQLLYSIDPLQYQTTVDQSKGQVAAAEAELANAEANLKRIRPLAEINAVSKRELDAAVASYEAAKAQRDANIANLANQRIELSYTKINSPIDGLIGISSLREGDYVSALGSSILNTVSDIRNIRVRFSISEREYLRIQRLLAENPNARKEVAKTHLTLADNTVYPETGVINFADRQIDPQTGTLTIESIFPNPNNVLIPGQFVRIKLVLEERKGAILVPQRAVNEVQGVYQVFAVDPENKLSVKMVNAGQQIGDEWIIDKGLSSGDRLAIIGNLFIQPGSTIKPVDANWPEKK